jgi:ketol-acid reductoisomerase
MEEAIAAIRGGEFARFLVDQEARGYPDLRRWRERRSERLENAERRLRGWLRGPSGDQPA